VSRIKAPPEKKRASYTRDHRTRMEAPHAFRKNWPKKKARINRSRRRVADRAVQEVLKGADVDRLVVPKRTRGEHLRKDGVAPLKDFVTLRQERRRTSFLPGYVGGRYDSKAHGAEFARFLSSLVRGRSPLASERAAHLAWLLYASLPNNSGVLYRRRWLAGFFEDWPQWEARVQRWIDELKAIHPRRAAEQSVEADEGS
jgi:hypothetical protein